MGSDLSLEALMLRYAEGDRRAFDRLHGRIEPRIRATLRRWLRSEAEVDDAVQVTLLKIHKARHRYRPGAPVLPWVLTIARHVAVDELRRPARRERELDAETLERIPGPEPDWTGSDQQAVIVAVREAIEELPASSREVIRRHKLGGQSMAEVAEALGIKEGAARVRAHRGYKALASRLLGFRQTRLD